MTVTDALVAASMNAQALAFEEERAQLSVRIMQYRALLEEHGIGLPNDESAALALEHYRACGAIAQAALALVDACDTLRPLLARLRTMH